MPKTKRKTSKRSPKILTASMPKMPKMPKMPNFMTDICAPAKFHILMGVLALSFGLYTGQTKSFTLPASFFSDPDTMTLNNIPNVGVFIAVFVAWNILWASLLNFICSKGAKDLAWFIALFPYIIFSIGMFNVFGNMIQKTL